MAPEKVGDAWDEFEVAAWLGFTFLFQQSGYNFFCSSANTCECHTDHQGLMTARMVMALRKIALRVNYFGHGFDNGLGFLMAFMMMKYFGPNDDLDDNYTLAFPE